MKTLSIINNHLKALNEQNEISPEEAQQPADAADTPREEVSAIGDTGGESFLIELAVDCFLYGIDEGKPTPSEVEMVLEAKKKYMMNSPNKVATTLRSILGLSGSDKPVSNLLTKNQ
jgi:hypothetical protein